MSQELFMRDDIIEVYYHKLDSECYNIKAYRKRKSKSKKVSAFAATTDIGLSEQQILRINKSMDKSQFGSNKGIQQKRISLTAALKKRPQILGHLRNFNKSVNIRSQLSSSKKQQSLLGEVPQTAKINYSNNTLFQNSNNRNTQRKTTHQNPKFMQNIDQSNVQLIGVQTARNAKQLNAFSRNKYRQVQKRVHKNGPLSQKSIQNWLDQILIQYCHEQQFDKSIQNAALKKMSIDRNSLLSQGIKPQYVNRVYKSLFVYSIGFNNLLKQLSGKNTHLKKTIWKVYAILLQFCSQGTFQTMIGQIQRDKIHKLESLRQEIQKRQMIIQNNDQINQQKNAKIFKELKQLKQQNSNLQNQKNVLMQDFKQAQQSFNQQVSIRLKFQNKINQIYGIHNQLNNKHQRLYDDYSNKLQQATFLQQKLRQMNDLYLITKQKLTRTQQQLDQQKRNNQTSNQMLSKYQQMRTRFQNSQIELKNSKQDLLNIIKQKSRKISQLQVELQNSQIMLKLSKSSYKQLEQQYRQSLQENKKLHGTIRDQINQLNQLFTQKKNFNQKHMSYVAEIEFLKNKDSQNKINIDKLKKQLKQQRDIGDSLFLEKTTLQKKVDTFQLNLKDCYQNIQNMKKTKNIYQEQLVYLKKRSQLHGQIVRQKDQALHTLTRSNQKLIKQNQELITLNKSLDSKTTVLAQRLRSQQEINKKKYDKLKQQRDQLFKQNSQHNAILQQKVLQLEKYMSLYDKQMLNLKNQRFERVNLDLRYKQSLQVMQNQNQHIKNLNIIISEKHEQIEEWQRKYRNFQYILKQKQHLFQVQRNSLKTYLEQARRQVTKKKMYLNPMIVQDLKSLLKRSIQKYDKLLAQYNQKIKQFKSTQTSLNTQIQNIKSQSHKNSVQQQQVYKKQLSQKQYQIQYQKQKCKHLQQKLQSIEKLLNKNKSTNEVNNLKEKQMKYLSTIKQKSDNIEKLLKQLEGAHDHNNTLIKRISEVQNIISSKNQQISQLEKKMTKLSQQNQQLQRIRGYSPNNRQKQTVSSKMDDYDENLLAMNQNANNENINLLSVNKQNSKMKNKSSERVPTGRSNKKKLSSKDETEQYQGQQGDQNNINGRDYNQNSSNNKNKQKSMDKVVNPVWRNDLGKKLKNAFNYYAK